MSDYKIKQEREKLEKKIYKLFSEYNSGIIKMQQEFRKSCYNEQDLEFDFYMHYSMVGGRLFGGGLVDLRQFENRKARMIQEGAKTIAEDALKNWERLKENIKPIEGVTFISDEETGEAKKN